MLTYLLPQYLSVTGNYDADTKGRTRVRLGAGDAKIPNRYFLESAVGKSEKSSGICDWEVGPSEPFKLTTQVSLSGKGPMRRHCQECNQNLAG